MSMGERRGGLHRTNRLLVHLARLPQTADPRP